MEQSNRWAYSARESTRRPRKIFAGVVLSAVFAVAATTQALATQPDPEHKVTICHRTASDSNPYVEITIDEAALDAHLQNGSLYPVPEGGCPQGEPDPSISDS